MDRNGSYVERFVTAVHRRMVVLRIVERAGLGVLIGCGVALALMPVLVWRGIGTMPLVAGCLGLGLLGGVLWGVARRPNRLAAAVEADRQLKLADLMGTALFLRHSSGELDDVARSVVATAEARAAGLRASMVIVNRIGVRGWGGIGLTCGLVLVVGLITAGDRAAEANAGAGAPGVVSWKEETARRERGNGARSVAERDTRRVKGGAGEDEEDPIASAVPELGKPGPAAAGRRDPGGPGMSSEGTGAGAARSSVKAQPGEGLRAGAGGSEAAGHAGTSTGGTGAATRGAIGAAGNTAGGGGEARRPAPVWTSEQWARDRETALRAVQGGAVPDEYRGLVRDYFERK